MSTLLFDLESDGLLDGVTKIHCLVIKDIETGAVLSFHNGFPGNPYHYDIRAGVEMLQEADCIVGHNVIRFDIPVLKKFYPWFNPKGVILDTLVSAKLIWPNLMELDKKANIKDFPKQLTGRHSLEAWGWRLKAHKGDFAKQTDWKEFTPEMLSYCIQDVEGPTAALWALIQKKSYSEVALKVEHDFATIMFEMEQHGFRFDDVGAHALHATLVKRKLELEEQLQKVFPGWWEEMKQPEFWRVSLPDQPKEGWVETTKSGAIALAKPELKRLGWKLSEAVIKPGPMRKKHTPFNPGSRDHIARALKENHGWKPKVFTDGGKPQIDETTLEGLEYPEAKLLLEYLMLEKRLGQLAEGDNAWLKLVENGRMHGEVDTMGTWTSRCTHKRPNMGQVPAVDKPYGHDCRALFIPNEGHVLVGADASGIQLRALSHYLARWDEGKYVQLVTTGDVHTANKEATEGIIPTRDMAKTFIYAYLLGAGDGKIGKIIGQSSKVGKQLKEKFLKNFPAFKYLKNRLEIRVKESGSITGLDGRVIPCENAHFALAGLLQGFEAVIMKRSTKILFDDLTSRGWVHGKDWGFCAMVHDEWQMSSRKEIADDIGKAAAAAITKAGEEFNSKCQLAGAYKIGEHWAATH
jgi:DNA polymerase I-like protein with 3'-5' exonuclease and polymerase domains